LLIIWQTIQLKIISLLNFDFPDKDLVVVAKKEEPNWWTLYFDGAVNVYGNRAGVVMISPNRKQYPISIKL